ncbi:MAG: hypothetical protein J6Y36_04625 [Treponema sp.]|nr:hypothetical protein [Treponema sp.]
MPGLSQLRKLSEDVLRLGNEAKLRSERGEKPVVATIPSSVPDIDDSEDFVLGLPEKESDEAPSEEELAAKAEEEQALASAASDLENLLAGNAPASQPDIDLSGILNPVMDADDGIPDLSAFEAPPPPPEKKEPSIEDMSLDDLLNTPSQDFAEPEPVPEPEPAPEPEPEMTSVDVTSDFDLAAPAEDIAIPDVSDMENFEASDLSFDAPAEKPAAESTDEFGFSGEAIDLTADLPDELQEVVDTPKPSVNTSVSEAEEISEVEEPSVQDISIPDDISMPEDAAMPGDISIPETEASSETVSSGADEIPVAGDFGFDAIDTSGLDDIGSAMGQTEETPQSSGPGFGEDFDPSAIDLSGLDLGGDSGEGAAGGGEEQTPEVFDTSEMDGIGMSDFNIPETDSKLSSSLSSDFELDSEGASDLDFEIAGYTGADANPFDKNGRIKSQIATPVEEKRKNTLTDAEYKKFKNNLKYYPLNVRLAVEDMIVKNEFTDDVIFEVIEKILKKVPARQLASHLEKMLDIQLSVPRDFERRTAEEYEAYKQSIQYQLKNRILPAIVIGVFGFIMLCCIGFLTVEFVYKPIKAEGLYKSGYSYLEKEDFTQSEMDFNKAKGYKLKKKWFFRYAEGYRRHKQYERAENKYKELLKYFNHDKQAGLDYVRMELEDLANYEKAEDICRREVLDYHINDIDGVLLLGDVYLEWATELDSSKFENAYEQYNFVLQLVKKPKNEYYARLMRYSVRTDNLKDVLQYKEMFFPVEKSLSGDDWTEMSGYLMNKLYGNLAPQEEYLRESIEDVLEMLKRSIKYSPKNPIARYNMSRYYIESGNHERAIKELESTTALFKESRSLKKRDMYKFLNSYRLIGEQYLYEREFIKAQESLAEGIKLFEEKNEVSGLESDKNVGIMYSDYADIDYFISGDLENAYRNYLNSINNKNDNAYVRYKAGYIDYGNKNYEDAFKHFVVASEKKENDSNLLLALGNALALRDDDYAGSGYYERLINVLDHEISRKDVIMPQIKNEDTELIELYMKASNNLGVTQYRLARETGNSSLNGESIFNFQNSLRAYDALTRNPETMVRIGGTNLAEQNVKYVTSPITAYEPAIYTDIPRTLGDEKRLE